MKRALEVLGFACIHGLRAVGLTQEGEVSPKKAEPWDLSLPSALTSDFEAYWATPEWVSDVYLLIVNEWTNSKVRVIALCFCQHGHIWQRENPKLATREEPVWKWGAPTAVALLSLMLFSLSVLPFSLALTSLWSKILFSYQALPIDDIPRGLKYITCPGRLIT